MRKILLILLVIAAAGIIFIYNSRKDVDPAQFNTILNEMVHAANAKDIDIFMDFFLPDYNDSSGLTYTAVKKIVENSFEKFDSFDAAYEEVAVSFSKNSDGRRVAEVNLEIIVTGVKNGVLSKELIGGSGHLKSLTVYFRKSDFGAWKISKTEGFDEPLY